MLTKEKKQAIIQNRLSNLQIQKYEQELNIKIFKAVNDNDSLKRTQALIDQYDSSMAVLEAELAEVNKLEG